MWAGAEAWRVVLRKVLGGEEETGRANGHVRGGSLDWLGFSSLWE